VCFLEYNYKHKGYKCLDLSVGHIYISRDVVFDEHVFPFASMHPNAEAHLRAELALLPDLFHSPSNLGGTFSRDNIADSSLPASPSQDSARDYVVSGEKFGENGGDCIPTTAKNWRHFMCSPPGSNTEAEADPPVVTAATSSSDAGELPPLSNAIPVWGSSAAKPEAIASPSPHVVAQVDPVSESASLHGPMGSSVLPGSGAPPQSAASPAASPPVSQQGSVTKRQRDIIKPKTYTNGTVRWGMSASNISEELTSVVQALGHKNWVAAMDAEYQALVDNKT
jgi:hypothetical protein